VPRIGVAVVVRIVSAILPPLARIGENQSKIVV
jgi:hypothetical protein